jgi:hypothetical protein
MRAQLNGLAAVKPGHVESLDPDRLAGRRHPHQRASMRARQDGASGEEVTCLERVWPSLATDEYPAPQVIRLT